MKKVILILLMIFIIASLNGQDKVFKEEILVTQKYLLFPVDRDVPVLRINFTSDKFFTFFDIRLATDPDSIDFWVFMDVERFMNRKIVLSSESGIRLREGLELIFLDDKIKTEVPLYSEKLRQQLHFSPKRGWISDANGLVYYDGEYHLYYQHNPYSWERKIAHWGHAVSADLIHWEELPVALFPDSMGMMKSGSAVVDHYNTAGFQESNEKVMVAVYTAAPEYGRVSLADSIEASRQCIAFSNDRGRTFTKYEGNPVLPLMKREFGTNSRDPKVFWYEPDSNWVMVLFECLGNSIYTSKDLRRWDYESHVKGFWECSELFELPVDGNPGNTRWVMYGASGTYMIGSFDGKQFIPETNKLRYSVYKELYAGQTFNNVTDERRIQMAWGRIISDNMPFNQMITFPAELRLKTTQDGIRLHVNPIKEISKLYKKSYKYGTFIFDKETPIDDIKGKLLHIKLEMKTLSAIIFSVTLNGYRFTYDGNFSKLNDTFIPLMDSEKLKLEFIVDRNSIEVFVNDGLYEMLIPHDSTEKETEIVFKPVVGKATIVEKLEVHELYSIWQKQNLSIENKK
jgi:fructan beta-fructosidase